jgi:hypothetical protein
MSVYYISGISKSNNDSGVVLNASSAGDVLNNVAVVLNQDELPFASTVVDGENTNPALALGNFAYDNERPIVKGFTSTINGDSFSSSAAAVRSTGNANPSLTSSIHPVSTVRTRLESTAQREGRFNGVTGKYDAGYPDVQLDDLNVDIAANPTRANPGRIHFAQGKRLISTSYYPKTG